MKRVVLFLLLVFFISINSSEAYAEETAPSEYDGYVFWADSYGEALAKCNELNAELVNYDNGVGLLKFYPTDKIANKETVSASVSENLCEEPDHADMSFLYPNYIYETEESDFSVGTETDLQWHMKALNMDEAFKYSKGKGVKVAIVDSGVDTDNPYLQGGILYAGSCIPDEAYGGSGYSILYKGPEDHLGHGTHVAGIIRAKKESGSISGMAPECSLISIKALEKNGSTATGYTSWIARAVVEAIEQEADVINLSLGGSKHKDTFLSEAIEMATEKGITVVCAAGNYNGTGNQARVDYPASDPATICVTSIKAEGLDTVIDLAYSKYGDDVTVAAPGSNILSLGIYEETTVMSGTSMACAMVSAEAALLKSMSPGLKPDKIREYMIIGSEDLGDEGWDVYYGYGLIKPDKALKKLKKDISKDKKKDKDKTKPEESKSEEQERDRGTEQKAPVVSADDSKSEVKNDSFGENTVEVNAEPESDTEAFLEKLENIPSEEENLYTTQETAAIAEEPLTTETIPEITETDQESGNYKIYFIIPAGILVVCIFIFMWHKRRKHLNE